MTTRPLLPDAPFRASGNRLIALGFALLLAAGCADVLEPPTGDVPFAPLLDEVDVAAAHVEAGTDFTCALRTEGVAECWGRYPEQTPIVRRSASDSHFTQIGAGFALTCGLRDDGVVECWYAFDAPGSPTTEFHPASGVFTQLAVGSNHFCAVRGDGVIQCGGDNLDGQAPDSVVAATGTFMRVGAGVYHTCGVRADGVVECWGYNPTGAAPATRSPATGGFVQVTGGTVHSCGLRADGVIECWGSSVLGTAPDSLRASSGSFVDVDAGNNTTCAVRDDGVIQCIGANENGQAPATRSATGSTFVETSAGYDHTCGLREDGLTECWGNPTEGATRPDVPAEPSIIMAGVIVPGMIEVTWADNSAAESHHVAQRRIENGSPWEAFSRPARNAAGFQDSHLLDGMAYRYRVRSCNAIGCSGWLTSGSVLSGEPAIIPPAPTSLTAVAITSVRIDLAWTGGSGGENGFPIERRTRNALGVWGEFVPVVTGAALDSVYSDTSLPTGKAHEYRIRACNAAGCSAYVTSAIVSMLPAPTSLTAVAVSGIRIDLKWTGGLGGETGFPIERRTRNALGVWSSYVPVATAPALDSVYSETSVPPGMAHQYRIRACNAIGCSAFVTSAIVSPPGPATPSAVTILAVSASSIELGWTDASPDESGFQIQRRERVTGSPWQPWQTSGTMPANATAFLDGTVEHLTRYEYRVRACSLSGCSAWSAAAGAIANEPPGAPGSLVAYAISPTGIQVEWDASSALQTGYQLQRSVRTAGVWGPYQTVASPAAADVMFVDATVATATRYRYRIRACNAAGCSDFVISQSVVTP